MSEIIDATYKFLDVLDNSDLIIDMTIYKNKLLNNKDILNKIDILKKEKDNNKIIDLRKELYSNKDYHEYIKNYNELSFIILKINKKYSEYTDTRE